MTTYETISIIFIVLGLVAGIIKIYTKSQSDIAMINVRLKNTDTRIIALEKQFTDHVGDNEKEFERMHRDNREDFQRVFDRLDVISDKIGELRK
jgi:hypothetical protein